jgi:hypothetical protein
MAQKQDIINLINDLKSEAVVVGFDWPIQDLYEVDQQTLEDFYTEVAVFINQNSGF